MPLAGSEDVLSAAVKRPIVTSVDKLIAAAALIRVACDTVA